MIFHDNTVWIMKWSERMHEKFGPPVEGYEWIRCLAYAIDEAGNNHPSDDAIGLAKKWEKQKFGNTSCSQCGKWLGPGDAGVSHCKDHD